MLIAVHSYINMAYLLLINLLLINRELMMILYSVRNNFQSKSYICYFSAFSSKKNACNLRALISNSHIFACFITSHDTEVLTSRQTFRPRFQRVI